MNKSENYEAIVIGASAGGFEALPAILVPLPGDFPLPIIIVQHLHPTADDFMVFHFNEQCRLLIKQADEKEKILPGKVYIAPPGYHLLIEEDRTFSFSIDQFVNYTRPSIDVLFESAADAYGDKLIGIILTGANNDGSDGIKKIREKGGITIVQDPETARIDTMPRAAIETKAVDYILRLKEISSFLLDLVSGNERHFNDQ